MGMPGTLPTLNGEAVRLAIRAALALGCQITPFNRFDRKNYFYPDLPKAYQISQLHLPLGRDGHLSVTASSGEERTIRIHEIHMEEDAGKLIHAVDRNETYLDYNRCGVPLIEIVSDPDFRTPEEVSAYLERLCEMFRYAGISDCKMQEGSLRADVNISVRPAGETCLGTRTELKNLNSFKAIERAIAYESARQIRVIEEGGIIEQETRRWDDAAGVSLGMRSKENAQDYRYFPEPDLPPLNLSCDTVEAIRCELPEFAHERVLRFGKEYGLAEYDAKILCAARPFADLFEKTVQAGVDAKSCANWMLGPVRKILNDRGAEEGDITLPPDILAALILCVNEKKINRSAAITLLEELLWCETPVDLDRLIEERGLAQLSDGGAIVQTVAQVFAQNPAALDDYRAGKRRAEGFLIGQTMKALGGRADPVAVKQAVSAALAAIE